ncbi:type I secretion system permease/ATPase [Caballeronia mineralivorans]|jgi:ATP-binding cassette subfamily C protein|uniref:type I secretion system permease/ATPase n=1 Tax=Caballeronia mineralivorans TaxID=2010198 RepID=UPI0023F05BB4|nr:type I secretion system permease/ATPase [Caballeronia mineralivorans]MDB5565812.1 type secretion system permease/ATPase [Tardiphaga sp.]MDB5785146.1 type secretion system permease/ATPase [Caballeronia mineralivorans]
MKFKFWNTGASENRMAHRGGARFYRYKDELWELLFSCRSYFVTAMIFSLAINLLYLAGPLYMLQVYDRVLSSASMVTLVMLTLLLLLAFAALAGLDMVRARILARASIRLDQKMGGRVIAATVDASLKTGAAKSQYLRDFDSFRQCITGAGIHAMFDLPWAPIYIAVIFVLHPLLGAFALASAIVLIFVALLNERWVRTPLAEANEAGTSSYSFTDMSLRNSEVVRAMGMLDGLLRRWGRDRNLALDRQVAASDRAAAMSSLIRFLRLSVQSVILGLGAYLVIERATTVGAMFAASILLGRVMQPVEQIVGAWRPIVSALNAYKRVGMLLKAAPIPEQRLSLPRPAGHLSVENVSYVVHGGPRPILRAVDFEIAAGELLGVVGPSGAGKSTLARHIVGVLAPSAGSVRLDGADVSTWPRTSFGSHVGYLPQDVELFADTVAANISRFNNQNDGKIIEAAKLAGVHDMILRLPNGYETQVGEGGSILSGGYRQRIGLARAIYGNPSLVVLDEPSSNLDVDGDAALTDCLMGLKKVGTSVVVVSHRPSTLGVVDKILMIRDGAVELFGPRAEMMARLTRPVVVQATSPRSAAS